MSDESVKTANGERARRLGELRDRASSDEYPQSWVPSDSEPMLAGEFLRLDHGRTSYGPQDIVVMRAEDGRERSVWLLHEVLRSQFARVRPRPGDLLCIRWKGKRTSEGGGNTYDDYRVEIDRGESEPDWSAVGGTPIDPSLTRSHEHLPAGSDLDDVPF
jgi:hypothetical protein